MVTLDASVWVGFLDRADPFNEASDQLLNWLQTNNQTFYSPDFSVLETTCAIARKTRNSSTGMAAGEMLRKNPALRFISCDEIMPMVLSVGSSRFLRGADAIYAATAAITKTQLITWDNELITRAGGMTPIDWLARQQSAPT